MQNVSAPDAKQVPAQTTSWAGVASLGLGVFALVMAEFLPASLLPAIAADLGVSEGTAGQAVTMTAIGAGLSGLFLPALLPRTDRRLVLIGLTAAAVVSDVLVAFAPNLVVLLAARLLMGVSLGGFWAVAIAMSARLVPSDYLGRAVTVINAGVSVATIAAVPLGTWLGALWGWRGVFLLAAGAALAALLVQAVTLPRFVPDAAGSLRVLVVTLRSRTVLFGLGGILVVVAGHFTGFTYIRPATESVSGIDASGLAVLLFVYGIANVGGTAVSGVLADRVLRVAALFFPAMISLGMVAMVVTGSTRAGLFVAVALWGFGFGGVPTTAQTWAARTDPQHLEQLGGVTVTVFQIAIALAAVGGGLLVDHIGATAPLVVGSMAAIVGGLLLVSALRPAAR
ncbi:MFS transporter [Paractinoplanes maris]|uniref:MFS transporter n=1 Tax=Paractinoplanes maris TaxID=1734446 RepID=UPI002021177D|nr:MFS transporter [Actinoplanes maris]